MFLLERTLLWIVVLIAVLFASYSCMMVWMLQAQINDIQEELKNR